MPSKAQITGMQGVYLVAAELAKRGFVVSPTSRSARGADLLVTDQSCRKAFSVQVKTNAVTFSNWLLSKEAKELRSATHIYVLVNLRNGRSKAEFFVVPSRVVAERMRRHVNRTGTVWHVVDLESVETYRERWPVFGRAGAQEKGAEAK